MAGKPVGVVEARKVGTTLSGMAEQTAKYQAGIPNILPHAPDKTPFAYESSVKKAYLRDQPDPRPRSRPVCLFPRPVTLGEWLEQDATLPARLTALPPLITAGIRDCQVLQSQDVLPCLLCMG
jgi:type I restriction enzyme R subunit